MKRRPVCFPLLFLLLLTACHRTQPEVLPPAPEPVQTEISQEASSLASFYALAALPEEARKAAAAALAFGQSGAAAEETLASQIAALPLPSFEDCTQETASVFPAYGILSMRFNEYRSNEDPIHLLCDAVISMAQLGVSGQNEPFVQSDKTFSDGAVVFAGMQNGYPIVFRFFCTAAHADRLLGNRTYGAKLSFSSGAAAQLSDVLLYDAQSGLHLRAAPNRLDDYIVQPDGSGFTCVSRDACSSAASGFLWSIRRVTTAEGLAQFPEQADELGLRAFDDAFVLARSDTDWYILSFETPDALPRCMNTDAALLSDAYSDSLLALDSFARDNDLEANPWTEDYYCAFLQKLWGLSAWNELYCAGLHLADSSSVQSTVQDANTGLFIDVPSTVSACMRYGCGYPGEVWDGRTVFALYDLVSDIMGAGGQIWTLERVGMEQFFAQEQISGLLWDDWQEKTTADGKILLGKTNSDVFLLRFAQQTQCFADIPASVAAMDDFSLAGADMAQSFLTQNQIEANPHWKAAYLQRIGQSEPRCAQADKNTP